MGRVSFSETMAAHGELIAQNTKAGMAAAARVEASMAQLQGELAKTNEIAEKTARHQEEMAIRARIADEEKKEQKGIKDVVFSFKQDLDIVLRGSSGLKRYIGLKNLSDVGKMELAQYTNKLIELREKEFSDNLLNTVYESASEAFHSLNDTERDDLRKIELLGSSIASSENEVSILAEEVKNAERYLYRENTLLDINQREHEYLKKLPSRLGSLVRLLISIVLTYLLALTPLLLLYFGGIRKRVGCWFKVLVSGTKIVNESAQKISTNQQEFARLGNAAKVATASLEAAKEKLAASENELALLFSSHDLSAS